MYNDPFILSVLKIVFDKLSSDKGEITFSALFDVSGGYAFKSTQYADEGIFVLRVTNLEPNGTISGDDKKYIPLQSVDKALEKFYLNENDIIMVMVGGSIGKTGVVGRSVLPALLNQNLWKITNENRIDYKYVFYLCLYLNNYKALKTFSSHGHFSRTEYRELTIPNLNAKEARQVAKFLDSVFNEQLILDTDLLEDVQDDVRRLITTHVTSKRIQKELDQQQSYLEVLRQTILQEAVQGKLTKQNPTDEPATELLKRIKAEKEKLTKAGKFKKEKKLPPITEDEIPLELPEGWVWCRLGQIIDLRSGVTLGKVYKEEVFEVPYLRVANVQRGYIDVTHVKTISVPKAEIEKYNLEDGDLCMIEGGDWDKVGRCGIWNNEISPCIHQNHIFRLRFYGSISNRWSEMFLNSPIARRYFESCSKQTTNLASINKTQLTNLLFPIPPLAEQQRIVAKVQQLQQQLSQLGAQVHQSRQYAQQLLQSVLKEAFEHKGKVYKMKEEQVSMVAED